MFLFLLLALRCRHIASVLTCTSPQCLECLGLKLVPRETCYQSWLSTVVRKDPIQLKNALCAASELVISGILPDCHSIVHSIGMQLGENAAYPKLSSYKSWDDLRERSHKDVTQCRYGCANGCIHSIISIYVQESVRRLDGTADAANDATNDATNNDATNHDSNTFLVALSIQLEKYCQTITEWQPGNWQGHGRYDCYHGLGHGLVTPPNSADTLFDITQAYKICDMMQSQNDRIACRAGSGMQNFHLIINNLKLNNPSKTFQDLRTEVIQLMQSLCTLDYNCGESAAEILMIELNFNQQNALTFCGAAYEDGTNALQRCRIPITQYPSSKGRFQKTPLTFCNRMCQDLMCCQDDSICSSSPNVEPSVTNTNITNTNTTTRITNNTVVSSTSSTSTSATASSVPISQNNQPSSGSKTTNDSNQMYDVSSNELIYFVLSVSIGILLCLGAVCGYRIIMLKRYNYMTFKDDDDTSTDGEDSTEDDDDYSDEEQTLFMHRTSETGIIEMVVPSNNVKT